MTATSNLSFKFANPRHFLRDDDLTPQEYLEVVELALQFKRDRFYRQPFVQPFGGPEAVAIIFDKNSTRTRVSFSVGVAELGGYPLVIDSATSQISRGEPIADTAHVLERMVSTIVWRTFGQERVEEMAANSHSPVINSLTDEFHPCQILADLSCFADLRGGVEALKGATLVYLGDGANNMAHSYLLGCATAGVNVRIGCPVEYSPSPEVVAKAKEISGQTGAGVLVTSDAREAVEGADIVTTDAWLSMGMDKDEEADRAKLMMPFQVNENVMALAKSDAVFMHCLPAYRGKEVVTEVIDGPQSRIFDEAEFRLHAQKALMTWLIEHSE